MIEFPDASEVVAETQEPALSSPGTATPEHSVARGGMALLLSLFPGCGHLYQGRPWRAMAWCILFLAVFVPFEIGLYLFWCYSPNVWGWILAAFAIFWLLCARGPVLEALRPPRSYERRPGKRVTSIPILGVLAAASAFGAALEGVLFRGRFVRREVVMTGVLAPLLEQGKKVSVLVFHSLQPVHGEIVLLEPSRSPKRGEPAEVLGRVLAKPGDRVEARGGRLLVNALPVDFRGAIDYGSFEKAGRRGRWRTFTKSLPDLRTRLAESSSGSMRHIAWGGQDWGPLLLSGDAFLVVPDLEEVAPQGETEPSTIKGWLVSRDEIVGRRIP